MNNFSLNGNSAYCAAADDRMVQSLPWIFRLGIPGYRNGWPDRG